MRKRLLQLAVVLLLVAASSAPASARRQTLRWIDGVSEHPTAPRGVAEWVGVFYLGALQEVLPVPEPDADGVYSVVVFVPSDAEVTIRLFGAEGQESGSSNSQLYGERCAYWDYNADRVIGGPDFTEFGIEAEHGWNVGRDWAVFQRFYGQACP